MVKLRPTSRKFWTFQLKIRQFVYTFYSWSTGWKSWSLPPESSGHCQRSQMPPGNVVNFQACCLIKDLGKKFFYSKRGWANSVFVPSVHHSSNNLDFRLKRHRFQVLFSKKPHRVKFAEQCNLLHNTWHWIFYVLLDLFYTLRSVFGSKRFFDSFPWIWHFLNIWTVWLS